MINISIVGAGIIAGEHLEAIKELECCRLVCVCDVNEERAVETAKKYGVPYFTDYRDIPENTQTDAVILNLPHNIHAEASEFFLDSGIHVLVEKPMANTTAECDRMLAAAARSGKKLAVGHIQRFFNANMRVKEIVETGKLGKLCMMTEQRTINYFSESRPKWFLSKAAAGGGIVMNYGAHALDKLFYVTGCHDAEIFASAGNIKNDADIEGHAQILLKLKSGISANVSFCGYSSSGYDTYYYFTDGTLRVAGGTELLINDGTGWRQDVCDDKKHMQREIEEFCKYVRGEASVIPDGEYGRAVIAAIEKIYADSRV